MLWIARFSSALFPAPPTPYIPGQLFCQTSLLSHTFSVFLPFCHVQRSRNLIIWTNSLHLVKFRSKNKPAHLCPLEFSGCSFWIYSMSLEYSPSLRLDKNVNPQLSMSKFHQNQSNQHLISILKETIKECVFWWNYKFWIYL